MREPTGLPSASNEGCPSKVTSRLGKYLPSKRPRDRGTPLKVMEMSAKVVSANSLLRREMEAACRKRGIQLYMPLLKLCGDNAAMIGSAAYYHLMRGEIGDLTLNAKPALRL